MKQILKINHDDVDSEELLEQAEAQLRDTPDITPYFPPTLDKSGTQE